MSRGRAEGRIAELAGRLHLIPRGIRTHYQSLCLRLGELMLDLPVPEWHRQRHRSGKTMRESDELVIDSVECWILDVAKQNPLAGMVLLDAVDIYCDWLTFVAQKRDFRFGDTQFKKDFTFLIKHMAVDLEILPGWQFKVIDSVFVAGEKGRAFLLRCHLSTNRAHLHWGLGRIVGARPEEFNDLGYFNLPCVISRHFGKDTEGLDKHDRIDLTATIPYRWITHWEQCDDDGRTSRMVPAPTDEEILAIAKRMIGPVQDSEDDAPVQLRIAGGDDE